MDGCSQMVFCTHLSYTDDKEKGGSKQEKWKEKKNTKKQTKSRLAFIDCKVGTELEQTLFKSGSACSTSSFLSSSKWF